MKKTIILTALLFVGISQAQADIVCQFSKSNYGLSAAKLVITDEVDIVMSEREEKGEYTISLSESECEDSTLITIDKKDVAAYKAGKVIEAFVSHETPDVHIKGHARCQLKK